MRWERCVCVCVFVCVCARAMQEAVEADEMGKVSGGRTR